MDENSFLLIKDIADIQKNAYEKGKREAWEKMRPYCDSRILDEDNYYCLDNNENPCNDFNQCPAMLTPDSGETKSAKEG